ncbi:MAG: molybdenum cofactor biosynthesis protein MoeB, partial [Halobacteriovoraceae bacterium]|nr:molybdenum cofactor biosynthesis protein MoeB [Halobacteriovoraceae bacterium]
NFNGGPCYRCLYPSPPPPELAPNCEEAGVLGVLPGLIGTLQATEVIKVILNLGSICSGKLIHYDALDCEMTSVSVPKKEDCPLCGDNPSIVELPLEEAPKASLQALEISPKSLEKIIDLVTLIDVREPFEREICLISEAISIPLKELENRLQEVPRDSEIIIHCKMGGRSLKAVELLQKHGIKARSLAGGILRWADEVDSSLAKY